MKFWQWLIILVGLGLVWDLLIALYDGYFHLVSLPFFAAIAVVAVIINAIGFWMGRITKFWW